MLKRLILCTVLLGLSGCKLGGMAAGIEQPVVLRDTISGQTVTITEDGPFSFTQAYASGAQFDVEVAEANQQLCTVSQGSGTFGKSPITQLKLNCEPDTVACTAQFDPVCAKATANIACITTPCPDHAYQTFPNRCEANSANAQFSFNGSCEQLEGALATDDTPVQMVPAFPDSDGKPVKIVMSSIENDSAIMTIQHPGGCGDHNIQLLVHAELMPGQPVVADTRLVHSTEDRCDALITREYRFDLLPVKAFYQRLFNKNSGRVAIRQVGNYEF